VSTGGMIKHTFSEDDAVYGDIGGSSNPPKDQDGFNPFANMPNQALNQIQPKNDPFSSMPSNNFH